MKNRLILIMAIFAIGMIALPQHNLYAGKEPPPTIYVTPNQASLELLAQAGSDSQVIQESDQAINSKAQEEKEFHTATVLSSEDASPPGINWGYVIPALIGLLEIIFRLVPTSVSITPLSLLYQILGVFIPDKADRPDTTFTVKKE